MIRKISSNDEWNHSLSQLALSKLVGVSLTWVGHHHGRSVLAQLQSTRSKDPGSLVLCEELCSYPLLVLGVSTLALEAIALLLVLVVIQDVDLTLWVHFFIVEVFMIIDLIVVLVGHFKKFILSLILIKLSLQKVD